MLSKEAPSNNRGKSETEQGNHAESESDTSSRAGGDGKRKKAASRKRKKQEPIPWRVGAQERLLTINSEDIWTEGSGRAHARCHYCRRQFDGDDAPKMRTKLEVHLAEGPCTPRKEGARPEEERPGGECIQLFLEGNHSERGKYFKLLQETTGAAISLEANRAIQTAWEAKNRENSRTRTGNTEEEDENHNLTLVTLKSHAEQRGGKLLLIFIITDPRAEGTDNLVKYTLEEILSGTENTTVAKSILLKMNKFDKGSNTAPLTPQTVANVQA